MKRNSIIDIMKGIGIILMVMGHSGFVFTRLIYQFHMAMFFIIAGYCFNNEKYTKNKEGLIILIKNRIKTLYVPCLLFNSFIVLLHNVFIKYSFIAGSIYNTKTMIITLFKCLLFSGGESLSGAMWFLRTMFFSTLIFATINFLCEKYIKKSNIMIWFIYIIFLFIGFYGSRYSFGKYFNILSVLILFQIGNCFRNKISINLSIKRSFLLILFGFILISTSLYFTNSNISLSSNRLINPLYFVICSCSGTIFCLGLSNLINKTIFNKVFIYIGKNTLPIVMYHFLTMKIVTFIEIILYNDNISKLASHPYLYTNGIWCILYVVIGVFVPLLIYEIYKYIRRLI